ncbi:hypothetical protein HZI73_22420 [Vallitalea pronyensis]|uniref:Morphogenetic protein n=1 Tax=Vallitalea pronyensis TaxID=1348613 RepID=A0A8J8MNC8_9FIRM|nr:hypothetical protein [Vallitalea pronyensis]QUI24885.1 hypothetical protein HZI73_22420 [Vallitalea pronyensis]
MKERPILFNTDMVKAILEGRKTQTRRVIKGVNRMDFLGQIVESTDRTHKNAAAFGFGSFGNIVDAEIERYIKIPCFENDILYVRETWKKYQKMVGQGNKCYLKEFYGYKSDEDNPNNPSEFYDGNWIPSIHMPKQVARIFLKVTNVRVERLQDITAHECVLEGIDAGNILKNAPDNKFAEYAKKEFEKTWDSIYKNWNENPWVWVIEFERVEREVK